MMRPRWMLAAAALAAAGCVSVEESPQEAGKAESTPPAAVVAPTPRRAETAPPTVAAPEPPVSPAPAQPARASAVEALIADYARLRRLPTGELAREQEAARQEFNQTRSDPARVRFAMALGAPGGPASDEARALELLDPLARTPGASLHALAVLLSAHFQDQRRLATQVQSLQQNVQGLQQNVNALQQKLDAIKSLERSLSGREAARSK